MTTIAQGNTGRLFVAFTPVTGVCALFDVHCTVTDPFNVSTFLPVFEDGTNRFYADIIITDTSPPGEWQVRWDSDYPSPLITVPSSFTVVAYPGLNVRQRSNVGVTVQRIRRQLDASIRHETNQLGTAIDDIQDVITLEHEFVPACRPGAILSIDNELLRVIAANPAAHELTVLRGWQDSTAAVHTDGGEVLISPRFTLFDIKDAMVAEIESWAPRLFRVTDYQWDVTADDESVELPLSLSPALGVISVRRQWSEDIESSAWPELNYRLMRGSVGVWAGAQASGLRIRMLPFNGHARSGAVLATLAMPFDASSESLDNDQDLIADYGLLPSMLELVELGVKMRIMADAESGRSARTQQDEPRRAEETPPGAALTLAQTWRNTYTRRFGDEVRKLLAKYPVRSW